jgi:hypothetical protein
MECQQFGKVMIVLKVKPSQGEGFEKRVPVGGVN